LIRVSGIREFGFNHGAAFFALTIAQLSSLGILPHPIFDPSINRRSKAAA
jgi:hypothetical protein